ncbi:muramidase [Lactobacillus johnsonii]|jgi:flagellum-specific peptidoglycan hydrolase FlgJ|uniref:glycoside hydrolase family 73 protein n=1 Tax=Lactobacillus johnsonii TaxID=33959 RepID=UPI0010723C07|nr:glycoside hydrolase family 73 protein [Lactobacillus johnsonii]MBF0770730.1 glucosaminidase domain-containing protein [Lactobacillus johnsonii]MCF1582555.1 glucosaminidase domain-containing protein [Lactobacillus johnsonii]QMT68215.1 glucosaminidase domain-containing protein [Lactobacillus johnsonii]TFU80837.1 muramidase [Lactobacillus johnsonii]UKV64343.1 glucosaminidase domain-containing protein [Lactobacillus johnsonii]
MKKRTFTGIATAALITTAGISVTNNLKPDNPLKTGEGTVQAATYQQEFLDKAIPAATTASSKYGTYTSVMLAQATVESAWGQSGLAQEPNNNLFGIKGSYNGQSVNMNTGEYGNGGYYTTNAGFRKYPSYTESFEDNGALLRNQMGNYYSGTWVENSNNYAQATQNGLQGKYATDPNYAKTLNSVIATNGFDKYDPVTQVVNENRTVAQTTPVMSAPVDPSVGIQVDTARVGQNVNVTKYITYNNGVKRAFIGNGWINALAFSPITNNTTANNATANTNNSNKQTTTTNNQASQPVKTPVAQTQQAQPQAPAAPVKAATVETKKVAEVKTPAQTTTLNVKAETKAAQPVKQLATSLAATSVKKEEVKKEAVKAEPAKTTPVKVEAPKAENKETNSAPVVKAPEVKTTNTVKNAETVKKETTPVVKVAEVKKAEAPVVKPAKTVKKETTPVVKVAEVKKAEAPVVKPVETVKKETTPAVKTTPVEESAKVVEAPVVKPKKVEVKEVKTTPVTISAKTVVKPTASVENVAPVQSYQSAVSTAAANNSYGTQWISTNTAPKAASTVLVKVTKTTQVLSAPNGQKLNQQVEAGSAFVVIASKYANGNLYYEISNGKWIMAKYTTQEAQITAKSGVLTINSKPDYGVAVWRVPGQDQISGKFLKDGSSWRYFRVANVNGQTWYDLGGNQWISAKSVLVR